jgi:hypothetical protein
MAAKTAGPSVGPAPVIPLFLLAAGGYLLWFGVHYWRDGTVRWPTDPVKGVLQGKGIPPHVAATTVQADLTAAVASGNAAQAAAGAGGAGAGTGATGSALADFALADIGHAYKFSGACGPDGSRPWDCSSAAGWWIGHQAGYALPGGSWAKVTGNGSGHGPATGSYLLWGSAIARADVAAGDVLVYQTHMGIAISGTEMVSAEDPADGTRKNSIDGMTASLGEKLFCRRVAGGGGSGGARTA